MAPYHPTSLCDRASLRVVFIAYVVTTTLTASKVKDIVSRGFTVKRNRLFCRRPNNGHGSCFRHASLGAHRRNVLPCDGHRKWDPLEFDL